jgi:tetratricopeptide (TPR) repeat protein
MTTSKRPVGRRIRRLRYTAAILSVLAIVGVLVGFVAWKKTQTKSYRPGELDPEITSILRKELPPNAPTLRFVDVTSEAGLDGFRAFAGNRSSQLPEDMGCGAAWGDYDNDGDDDLFLVSGGGALTSPRSAYAPSQLYENRGDGSFRRVTTFPDLRINGMGAAWGDVDGDGWLDLAVSGYDTLLLIRNERGTFRLDANAFGDGRGFWAGVVWGDYDNDDDLDLYVCGYVQYEQNDADRARVSEQYGSSVPYTLNPASYKPTSNRLYRNRGNGTFDEVAEALGVANPEGRSLSALWHDFDNDGWLDLYVANDVSDNAFYRNVNGRFEDISHAAWVADYRGAMGLAAGDWNRDGDDDLFITHWLAQENALYDSLLDLPVKPDPSAKAPTSALRFMDIADARGLGQIALQVVGWGTEFADLDRDGWLDLLVANGSTIETEGSPKGLKPQKPFLFWNNAGERFYDMAPLVEPLRQARVGRGLAASDYDNDGDVDFCVMHLDGGVQLLRNEPESGNWLEVRLHNATGFGEGANVTATVGAERLRRTVGGASYLSQSSRRVHFGLGEAAVVTRLEVRWLGRRSDVYTNLAANAIYELTEGNPKPKRVTPASSVHAVSGAPLPSTDVKARTIAFWEKHRAAMNAMKKDRDYSRAAALFREALVLDPKHEDARYYLGNCLAELGDLDGAIREFESLTGANPRSHRGWSRQGTLRAIHAKRREDLFPAQDALERALSLNPEETGALLVLGEIALMRGDEASAKTRLEWACRSNPRAVGGFFLRGYLAWKAGDSAAARQLLAQTRQALGNDWKPRGTTSEGDTTRKVHDDSTPLSRFWENWDGNLSPDVVYPPIKTYLARRLSSAARS